MDGNGLRLFVRDTGARFWIFRYTMAGITRAMGLGRAGAEPGAVPLSEARQKAGDLHRLVRSGTDPLAQRDAEQAAAQQAAVRRTTFREAAERFIAGNKAGWRNPKHRAQWGSTLVTYAYPHMGDLPVADVATEHVLAALHPIWTTKAETAARLRGRRRCWITPAPLDFGPGTTPRGGGGICPTRCRHTRRWRLAILADVARLRLSDAPDAFVFPSMSSAMRN